MKILCIFSKVLGGKTVSAYFQNILDNMTGVKPTYFFLEPGDYSKYKVSSISKVLGSTAETLSVFKQKWRAEGIDTSGYDALFFQSYELTALFRKEIQSMPTLMRVDTTPVLAQGLVRQETDSLFKKLRSHVAQVWMNSVYGNIFTHIDHILTATEWAKSSFVRDYKINPEAVTVSYPARDLDIWKPLANKPVNGPKVLLFVGNDFKRKGGEFLIKLYQKHLKGRYKLRIISNDAMLTKFEQIEGVEILRGIGHQDLGHFIKQYQTADAFIFPTLREQLGIVLTEALSAGLPVVARNVGGAGDVVKNDYNGYLLDYEADIDQWARVIDAVCENEQKHQEMSKNSRKLAEQMFNRKTNAENICRIVYSLAGYKDD